MTVIYVPIRPSRRNDDLEEKDEVEE